MLAPRSCESSDAGGFALIEAAIVLVMLGLVFSFVLPRLGGAKNKAYIAAMKNDLRNYATAEEQYFHDHGDGYGLPDQVEAEENFAYSENVHPDSSDVGDGHYYLRVRHDKTDVKCELDYRRSATVNLSNRVQCPGAGDSDEEELEDNSPPEADFTVAGGGSSSTSPLTGSTSPEELRATLAPSGDGSLEFSSNSDITFDGSLSTDPDGDPLTYTWRFAGSEGVEVEYTEGDGLQFTNRWLVLGSYDVTLMVTDEHGAVDDTTKTLKFVESNAAPAASFSYNPSDPAAGEAITFDGSASDSDGEVESYFWSFGGQGTSKREDPTFTFDADGTYTVAFYATDNDGATAQADTAIVIGTGGNTTPIADFDWSPPVIEPGETIQLNNKSSDPDGSIVSHFWGFEGGGSSTEENPTVSFATDGTFRVSLTVTDNDGATAELNRSIKVGNEGPVADFTWNCIDLACDFYDQSSDPDGVITTWAWQFADQDTSTEQNPSHAFPSLGSYPVTLTVTDNDGATASVTKSVAVDDIDGEPLQAPTADFTWTPTKPDTGEVATFTDASSDIDGTIVSREWNFNGLGTDSGTSPTFVFPTEGDHPVTLTIEDNDNHVVQVTKTVEVGNEAPNADFGVSCVALDCTFDDASTDSDGWIEGHHWTFGEDGPTSTEANPAHTFPAEGGYEVTLQVTDDDGATDQVTRTLFVGPEGPVAAFDYSPAAPMTLDTVSFDGSVSIDPDGTISSYSWDLDGNGTEDETGATVTHVYTDNGTYPAALTVTDNDGLQATLERSVSVGNRKPYGNVAVLVPSGENFAAGVLLQFMAVGAGDDDGQIASYRWDFGDGTELTGPGSDLTTDSGSAAPFDHTYSESGNYNVTLKLTDDDGATHMVFDALQVGTPGPTASISFSPSFPDRNEGTTFTGTVYTADGVTVDSYQWTFDEDVTKNGDTVTHAFSTDGEHTVDLRVVDSNGLSDQASATVKVVTTADPSFALSDTRVEAGTVVTATVDESWTSSPGDWSYTWNWGNSTSGSGSPASVTYSTAGTYTIALTAQHTSGITKTVTKDLDVDPVFDVDFTWSPTDDLLVDDFVTLSPSDPSGQADTWAWTIIHADGGTGTFSTESPMLQLQGAQTDVELVATSYLGYQDTVSKTITAQVPEISAAFTVDDNVGDGDGTFVAEETLTFDASPSTADRPIDNYEWSISEWSGTGEVVQRDFDSPGDHTVELVVTDVDGRADTATRQFTVEGNIEISFEWSDDNGGELYAGDWITLNGTASGGEVDTWDWYWAGEDEGGPFQISANSGNPSYAAAVPDADSLLLQVTFTTGTIASSSQSITVLRPSADFTITDLNGGELRDHEEIKLDATGADGNEVDSAEWLFLDSAGGFLHSFVGNPGGEVVTSDVAAIRLYATFTGGAVDTVEKAVTVLPPSADLTITDLNGGELMDGDTVELDATGVGGGGLVAADWQFLNSVGGLIRSFSGDPAQETVGSEVATVRLDALFSSGARDTVEKAITAQEPPFSASLTAQPAETVTEGTDVTLDASASEGDISEYCFLSSGGVTLDCGNAYFNLGPAPAGSYEFFLEIRDQAGVTQDTDSVTLTVQ